MGRREIAIGFLLTTLAGGIGGVVQAATTASDLLHSVTFQTSLLTALASSVAIAILFLRRPAKETIVSDEPGEVGKHNVVMGRHNFRKIGDGNVIIGPTDNSGNVILDREMTIGYRARGGPDSIVIGAFAGARADSTSKARVEDPDKA